MNCQKGISGFISIPIEKRFWEKVDKTNEDGCWIWKGYIDPRGYGRIGYKGKTDTASRISWLLHYGEIPQKFCVCHKCDNPACVRPDHLFLGTYKDNIQDMWNKGRCNHAGEHNGRARIDRFDVNDIQFARSLGVSPYKIADEFKLSYSQIHRIINGTRWVAKELEGR